MRQGALPVLLLACGVALSLLLGCAGEATPELLELREIQPSVVEIEDRVEIVGTRLPVGLAKEAEVVFRGVIRRPGQAPREDEVLRIKRAAIEPDRVSFVLGEAERARFCGEGDEATHATFDGDVEVRALGEREGGMAVRGVLRGVSLDVLPEPPRTRVLAAREHAGREVLSHLGLALRPEPSPGGGLVVEAVREESPAAEAGAKAGDVVLRFDGLRVLSLSDLVPSGASRRPNLVVLRGAGAGRPGETLELPISVEGIRPSPRADLLAPAILLGTPALLLLVLATPAGRALTWLEHRLAARFGRKRKRRERRLALLADHLLGRLGVSSKRAPGAAKGSRLAPALVFAFVSALFLTMPLSQRLVRADLDVGVTFLAAAASLVAVAFVTGGGSGKFSLLASLKASLAVLAAEVPALLATVAVVVASGSLELEDILAAQAGPGGAWLETGAWPWYWWVCRAPASMVGFALFFTTALVDCSPPGPLPELEPRGAATGPGKEARSLFFGFADGAHLLLLCGLASALFLGGWHLPGVAASAQRASGLLSLLGAALFLAKSWALALVVLSARVALPPLRLPELRSLALRLCIPLALVAALLTALPPLLLPTRAFENVLGPAAFAAFLALALHFGLRLRASLRIRPKTLALNPFL